MQGAQDGFEALQDHYLGSIITQGHGGTSTTGSVIKRLFGPNVSVLIDLVPENHRINFQNCVLSLNCLLAAYSSSREININVYCNLVQEVYTELLINIRGPNNKPWIFPSPTLHAFLSHSHELIDANNNYGLGRYSEQGLENNHKFLRFFRKTLSRKCSQEENLFDCFSRLWLQSDPIMWVSGRKVKLCCHCKQTTHFSRSCPEKKNLNPVSGPHTWCENTMKQLFVS